MERAGQNGNKKIQTKGRNWKEMNDTDEHKNQKYKEAEKRRKNKNTHGTPIEPFPTQSTHNHKKG